jgi:hypothetical protein
LQWRRKILRAELSSEMGEGDVRGGIVLLVSVGGGGRGAIGGREELLGGAKGAEALASGGGVLIGAHIFLLLAAGKGQWQS